MFRIKASNYVLMAFTLYYRTFGTFLPPYEEPQLTESAPDVSERPGRGESVVNGGRWNAEDDEQDVRDLSSSCENSTTSSEQNVFN